MFGELMKWNPIEELSYWHRDIDDLFGLFFERAENFVGSCVPRMETYRKDSDYVPIQIEQTNNKKLESKAA